MIPPWLPVVQMLCIVLGIFLAWLLWIARSKTDPFSEKPGQLRETIGASDGTLPPKLSPVGRSRARSRETQEDGPEVAERDGASSQLRQAPHPGPSTASAPDDDNSSSDGGDGPDVAGWPGAEPAAPVSLSLDCPTREECAAVLDSLAHAGAAGDPRRVRAHLAALTAAAERAGAPHLRATNALGRFASHVVACGGLDVLRAAQEHPDERVRRGTDELMALLVPALWG